MKIGAKVVEHSRLSGTGYLSDLITLEVVAPKFLDAELEKHRMISSNGSSDRAIPFKRNTERATFIPDDVRYNEKGMQGYTSLTLQDSELFNDTIDGIRLYTIAALSPLDEQVNVHKQTLNRYLLPYAYQTKVMTATRAEWHYFLNLRDSEQADPAVQALAFCIKSAINNSKAKTLYEGDWHLPYITQEERDSHYIYSLLRMSVARCARTSYDNHDGTSATSTKDIALFNMLVSSNPQHLSPLDHQGCPIPDKPWSKGVTHLRKDGRYGSGNFVDYIQFRHYYLQSQGN